MDKVKRNISLKPYNTFGLDAKADLLLEPETLDELMACIPITTDRFLILGRGSNLLFTNDFNGTVIKPANASMEVLSEGNGRVRVLAGAGVEWDSLVRWCVERNYGGLENLSLIPGTAGAAPVQNIGAYGVEVAETIEAVRVIDLVTGAEQWLNNRECRFGYRTSRFKSGEYRGKLIWEVVFSLNLNPLVNISYQPLREAFAEKREITIADAREAVIHIRQSKLPDPEYVGNAGSFFKNPVVSAGLAAEIRGQHPQMPFYPQADGLIKIPAGWLIEQCGWKGFREGDAGVYPKQALVLVNYGGATGEQILQLAHRISGSVMDRFGISLEREVQVLD